MNSPRRRAVANVAATRCARSPIRALATHIRGGSRGAPHRNAPSGRRRSVELLPRRAAPVPPAAVDAARGRGRVARDRRGRDDANQRGVVGRRTSRGAAPPRASRRSSPPTPTPTTGRTRSTAGAARRAAHTAPRALVAGAPVSLQPLGAHARGGAVEAVLEEADFGERALRVLRARIRLHSDTHTVRSARRPSPSRARARAASRLLLPSLAGFVRRRASPSARRRALAGGAAGGGMGLSSDTSSIRRRPRRLTAPTWRARRRAKERLADALFFAARPPRSPSSPPAPSSSSPTPPTARPPTDHRRSSWPRVTRRAGVRRSPRAPLVERGADASWSGRAPAAPAAAGALFSASAAAPQRRSDLPEHGAAVSTCARSCLPSGGRRRRSRRRTRRSPTPPQSTTTTTTTALAAQ